MRFKQLSIGLVFVFATTIAANAVSTETVLLNFQPNNPGGSYPNSALISDAAGNLYGTTLYGGLGSCSSFLSTGCGVVFELTRKAGEGWNEKVLHTFNNDGTDGIYPTGGLVFDVAGNLYGTTQNGGSGVCNSIPPLGCGTVFELAPKTGGVWSERVLHSFAGGSDGDFPQGGLILDAAGNLYGTTAGIANSCVHTPFTDCGTVFQLSHQTGGWTKNVLHTFRADGIDGFYPYGNLIFDGNGNLYGGTYAGGTLFDGTAFQLTPTQGGEWTEIAYSFYWGKGVNGGGPGGFVVDATGNFYGTSQVAGPTFLGILFKLKRSAGTWRETSLYAFNPSNGATPNIGLLLDRVGNVYGTDQFGGFGLTTCLIIGRRGLASGCGTVFKLTPKAGGGYTNTILHSFGNGMDGQVPVAGLLRSAEGRLYGTTSGGGTHGGGVVFEITP